MSQQQDNFKRGTAEMLILHLLQEEDLYGYQITRAFKDKSNGVYTMGEAALYLVLYRLVELGYITDYEKLVGARRKRRYYHLEDSGREYYNKILDEYFIITKSIAQILDREDIKNVLEK
ncbi:MAG: helix-turn-helix transcriptional regulator [Clostridia bacterium]|nr:helix-turn-helix transcriptional regulator [Clostridia bacterium]